MNDAALRAWAAAYPNMPQAVACLRILDENAELRAKLIAAAERIAAQSDALSRKAEREIACPN